MLIVWEALAVAVVVVAAAAEVVAVAVRAVGGPLAAGLGDHLGQARLCRTSS